MSSEYLPGARHGSSPGLLREDLGSKTNPATHKADESTDVTTLSSAKTNAPAGCEKVLGNMLILTEVISVTSPTAHPSESHSQTQILCWHTI